MLALVVSELTKKGALKYPKVFISPACGPEVQSLSLMVTSLKGEVAASQGGRMIRPIVYCSCRLPLPCLGQPFYHTVQRQASEVSYNTLSCLAFFDPSGTECVSLADSPGVTHIVKPFGPSGDPDDGVQYMRNLGIK